MPAVGETLDHYEIIRPLGKGGMGEVFLAQDADLEKKVALKFLPEPAPRGGGQPEAVTENGGQSGFESQRVIFYYWRQVPGQGAALMRRMGNGDGEVPLVPRGCAGCVTIPAAEGFYYVAADMNDVYLYAEDTGRSVHVFKRPSEPFFQFTISPDGRWFAYGLAGETSVDLMIMENFH